MDSRDYVKCLVTAFVFAVGLIYDYTITIDLSVCLAGLALNKINTIS